MTNLFRVVARYTQAFKYQPKENKQSKVERLMKLIREATGISRGQSEGIADAIVRNREVDRLAIQKSWPIQGGTIEGPKGSISVDALRAEIK
jgi:hypothetical protein